jgi:hypothetical protein
MPHLDSERLAALDNDAATTDELAHLAQCAPCRAERAAFDRLATLSYAEASRDALHTPRLTEWSALSAALRAEGLVTRVSGEHEVPVLSSESSQVTAIDERLMRVTTPIGPTAKVSASRVIGPARRMPAWMRTAAAMALVVGGVALGRVSAGVNVVPERVSLSPAASLASNDDEFASIADASSVLDRAQRDYQRASMWLASHDSTINAQAVYRARLSALEQMMMASRAGLYEAPQDPVLNQYYLAAYTAREATLRQLGAALPVDRVMERF